jgi:hypothetical protein
MGPNSAKFPYLGIIARNHSFNQIHQLRLKIVVTPLLKLFWSEMAMSCIFQKCMASLCAWMCSFSKNVIFVPEIWKILKILRSLVNHGYSFSTEIFGTKIQCLDDGYLERGNKRLSYRSLWIFLTIHWKRLVNMLKTVNFAENTTYREKWSYELRMLIISQLQNAMKIQPLYILRSSFLHCVTFLVSSF